MASVRRLRSGALRLPASGIRDSAALGVALTGFVMAGPIELFLPEHLMSRLSEYGMQWVIWPVSAAGLWLVPALRRATAGGFELQPSHFVERHGLVVVNEPGHLPAARLTVGRVAADHLNSDSRLHPR